MLKIPVGRLGEWKHPKYGTIKMSQQLFDGMINNFKKNAIGRDPFVRIGHDKGSGATFGDAKSEGWIKDLIQEGDTLFALAEPTNPDIAEMVQNKQYRYSSAEYVEDYVDKESGKKLGPVLEAIALTNEPFLTKLPEARVLADSKDTFYLDYEEVNSSMEKEVLDQVKQTNTLLGNFTAKLAEFFIGKKEDPKDPLADPTKHKDEDPKKLSEYETRIKSLEEENKQVKLAQRASDVEAKIVSYVSKGIPPTVLEQVKPILLSDASYDVIKLADDKTTTQAAQIYNMLDNFPEESRIKLFQFGTQHTEEPGSAESIKKLADEDMKSLGYKLTEDGKYKL